MIVPIIHFMKLVNCWNFHDTRFLIKRVNKLRIQHDWLPVKPDFIPLFEGLAQRNS